MQKVEVGVPSKLWEAQEEEYIKSVQQARH